MTCALFLTVGLLGTPAPAQFHCFNHETNGFATYRIFHSTHLFYLHGYTKCEWLGCQFGLRTRYMFMFRIRAREIRCSEKKRNSVWSKNNDGLGTTQSPGRHEFTGGKCWVAVATTQIITRTCALECSSKEMGQNKAQ